MTFELLLLIMVGRCLEKLRIIVLPFVTEIYPLFQDNLPWFIVELSDRLRVLFFVLKSLIEVMNLFPFMIARPIHLHTSIQVLTGTVLV